MTMGSLQTTLPGGVGDEGAAAPKRRGAGFWLRVSEKWLPFADVATRELPLSRLARLSLFQVSVGMALVLLNGTLNRVMIVELGMSASLVALMVALPLVFAPLRALVGHRSDNYVSALGWRRVPFIFFGTGLQFGGLAIMPFALLIMSGDAVNGPVWAGHVFAALAFLLVGAGLHTTQTAGLALANDIAPDHARPRVVAFLYVMLLIGMIASALLFGALLDAFSNLRLIKVIQGAAVVSLLLNVVALWKQEARNPDATSEHRERPPFAEAWRSFLAGGRVARLLVAVGLGTAAFGMQDILLEPYGGQVLGLSVSATTVLTALLAGGTLAAFALAERRLARGEDPHRLAALGAVVGVVAFSAVIFAGPLDSPLLFRFGAVLIGFGGGLFSVGTLIAAMDLGAEGLSGLALGAWGAVQATALGAAVAIGGALRDVVSELAMRGALGSALMRPDVGYSVVYHLEIALLFATLIAIGPLVRHAMVPRMNQGRSLGLAEIPG